MCKLDKPISILKEPLKLKKHCFLKVCLLYTSKYSDSIRQEYGNRYEFELLEKSDKLNEYRTSMLFYRIKSRN